MKRRSSRTSATIGVVLLLPVIDVISAWAPHRPTRRQTFFRVSESNIIDAEFERLEEEPARAVTAASNTQPSRSPTNLQTLLDMSLNADPETASLRVPFLDMATSDGASTDYIDVQLAFCVELDDTVYGIGVPFDHAVAIVYETSNRNKNVTQQYLNPDVVENRELCEIMAKQLRDQLSPDLELHKTPRVLTIVGDLNNFTKNWKQDLIPKPIEAQEFLENDDEEDDLKFFHDFMRSELGEEEYEKTLNEEPDEELWNLLHLFEEPKPDIDFDPEPAYDEFRRQAGWDQLERDSLGLKLISYVFKDEKRSSYSLIQLFKPFPLVARKVVVNRDSNIEDDTRFELLSAKEEQLVLPKLLDVCRDDLEQAGLSM